MRNPIETMIQKELLSSDEVGAAISRAHDSIQKHRTVSSVDAAKVISEVILPRFIKNPG